MRRFDDLFKRLRLGDFDDGGGGGGGGGSSGAVLPIANSMHFDFGAL